MKHRLFVTSMLVAMISFSPYPARSAEAYTLSTQENAVVIVTPLPLPKNEIVLPSQYVQRGYTLASYELTSKQPVTLNQLSIDMLVPKISLRNKKDIGLSEYIQDIHFVVDGDYYTLSSPVHNYGKQSLSLKSRPGEVFRKNRFNMHVSGSNDSQHIKLVPGKTTRVDVVVIFKDVTPRLSMQSTKIKTMGGQRYRESIIETRLSYYETAETGTFVPYYNDLSIGVEAFSKFDAGDGGYVEGDGINDRVAVFGPDYKFQQKLYIPIIR